MTSPAEPDDPVGDIDDLLDDAAVPAEADPADWQEQRASPGVDDAEEWD